jgi:hypothetical protein
VLPEVSLDYTKDLTGYTFSVLATNGDHTGTNSVLVEIGTLSENLALTIVDECIELTKAMINSFTGPPVLQENWVTPQKVVSLAYYEVYAGQRHPIFFDKTPILITNPPSYIPDGCRVIVTLENLPTAEFAITEILTLDNKFVMTFKFTLGQIG